MISHTWVYRSSKVRILALTGFALIISAIFAAIFLSHSGSRCLPPSALGITVRPKALNDFTVREPVNDLPVLNALVAAGYKVSKASPGRSETAVASAITDDVGVYCRAKDLDLLFGIGATALAALACGFWMVRKRSGS